MNKPQGSLRKSRISRIMRARNKKVGKGKERKKKRKNRC